jgi:hypothetical protein
MAYVDDVKEIVSAGLTIATTAYSIGDVVGTIFTTTGFASANAGTGVLTAATLVDDGDVLGQCSVYTLTATASVTNNSPWTPTDTEANTLVPNGRIDFPPPDDLGGVRTAATPLWVPYKTAAGSTSLWFVVITRTANAVFTAVDDVHLWLAFAQTS